MVGTRNLLGAATCALLLVCSCSTPLTPAAQRWWGHVEKLASDDMQGRNTGSPGYLQAAEYVAAEFERAGAVPGTDEGYFQQVGFVSRQIREDECRLALLNAGVEHVLELGTDANLGVGYPAPESVEAPVVFVGYGLQVPEVGHDDFAGLDLRGKVLLYIGGGPSRISGTLRAHAQKSEERWARMRATGAIGQIVISNPKHSDVPWERSTLRRLQASMELADRELAGSDGLQLQVRVNPDHAQLWFEGSANTFAELLAIADRGEELPRFPLAVTVRATIRYDEQAIQCRNVVAVIPGANPEYVQEYVVLSGHLDHLGVGGVVAGDSIYNGAMDNAAGIASIIEIARSLKDSGRKLERSLVLLAVTGEEKGLEGSKYFARYPTLPGDFVANVNLDMFMPIVPFENLVVYGLDESDLGDLIREVAGRTGVEVQADPEPDRNIFIRSDQYNFVKKGVPALSFKFGYVAGSPQEQVFKTWIHDRYHAPSDDLAQPVDKEAAIAFTQMLLEFSAEIANRPERPRWKDDSFFKRFAVEKPIAMR